MFIGSEAETEGEGGPDLPMKILSCHLFPHPPLELSGSAHACPTGNLFFYFLHVVGLAIILSRDNW